MHASSKVQKHKNNPSSHYSKIEKFAEIATNKLEYLACEINNIKQNKPYSILHVLGSLR